MNCYYCYQSSPRGLSQAVWPAIGICQSCGVGVCAEHGHRFDEPEARLLCSECATREKEEKQTQTERVSAS